MPHLVGVRLPDGRHCLTDFRDPIVTVMRKINAALGAGKPVRLVWYLQVAEWLEEPMAELCRSCHAEIDWAYSVNADAEKEKGNPINHDSVDDPNGNLAVWRDSQRVLRYRYLRKGELLRTSPKEHRGISHFATCPNAKEWRKK